MVLGRNKDSFSQNYITSSELVRYLIEQSNIKPKDDVVEIGPGQGIITKELAKSAKSVVAVEKDRTLSDKLASAISNATNVQIIYQDFLKWHLPLTPYKMLSNIPFSITSEVISKILKAPVLPDSAFFIMQKEAALKFVGEPFALESQSSVIAKAFFDTKIVCDIDRRYFDPKPQVDIVMIGFYKKNQPLVFKKEYWDYREFIVYGFSQWKGTVAESLKHIFTFKQLNILDKKLKIKTKKPSELDFSDWLDLYDTYKKYVPDDKKRYVQRFKHKA